MFRICHRLKKEDLNNPEKLLERESKSFFIEIWVFLAFFILAMILYGLSDSSMEHYQMKTMQQIFIDRVTVVQEIGYYFQFLDMKTVLDFWKYMETTFLDGIHGHEQVGLTQQKERFVAFENLLLGTPRIRQVRVNRDDGCTIHNMFVKHFHHCYEQYTMTRENSSAEYKGTRYYTAKETNNFITFGQIQNYYGGGYVHALSFNRSENVKIFKKLVKNEWIDRATRLVSVELALYNGDMDLYSEMKLAVEILPTGGVFPFHNIKVFRVMRLMDAKDYVRVVVLSLFYFVILIYMLDIVLMFSQADLRKVMWLSVWTYLDLIIVCLGLCSFILAIYLPCALTAYIKDNEAKGDEYLGMDTISQSHLIHSNSLAVLIFFIWVKVFKYIGFNKTMVQFSITLSKCTKDILGFGVMFLIVFFAFAQLGVLLFGSQNKDFSDLNTSIITMLRFILGDFDYVEIERANRFLGPIFFISYIILVFFILLNMFLAIVNDTYAEVKSQDIGDQSYLWLYVKRLFERSKCCKKKKDKDEVDGEEVTKTRKSLRREKGEKPDDKKFFDAGVQNLFKIVEQRDSDEFLKLAKRVAIVEGSMEKLHERLDLLIVKIKRKEKEKQKSILK